MIEVFGTGRAALWLGFAFWDVSVDSPTRPAQIIGVLMFQAWAAAGLGLPPGRPSRL